MLCSQRKPKLYHDDDFYGRMSAAGYTGAPAAENIGYTKPGADHPGKIFEQWSLSPGHASSITNDDYKLIGLGYQACPDGFVYWTADLVATV